MKRATPVQVVDAIEPALPFWKGLGFELRVEVPHGAGLGFVLLARGEAQVMLQTRESIRADLGEHIQAASILYLEVDDVDDALRSVAGAPVLVPRRTTFYGADEIFVRDGAGNVVGFAANPA